MCARFEKEITPSVYFYRDRNKPFSFLRHSRVLKRFDECEMLAPLNPYPRSNPGTGFDEVAAQTQYTWQASQDEKKRKKLTAAVAHFSWPAITIKAAQRSGPIDGPSTENWKELCM